MSTPLVRTTTYFNPDLLVRLKKMAIDENKRFYELLNEKLEQGFTTSVSAKKTATKPFSFTDRYSTFPLKLKAKKITRNMAYE